MLSFTLAPHKVARSTVTRRVRDGLAAELAAS